MDWQVKDVSHEVFGKYQHGTMHWGLYYSDQDFSDGNGGGFLRWGAIPDPSFTKDQRPWRGVIVELVRRAMGAKRLK